MSNATSSAHPNPEQTGDPELATSEEIERLMRLVSEQAPGLPHEMSLRDFVAADGSTVKLFTSRLHEVGDGGALIPQTSLIVVYTKGVSSIDPKGVIRWRDASVKAQYQLRIHPGNDTIEFVRLDAGSRQAPVTIDESEWLYALLSTMKRTQAQRRRSL